MFNTLSNKFEKIISSIKGKALISDDDLKTTLREIRIALLEADVALNVVKDLIENLNKKIIGQEVLKKIKPDQMIIKLVNDEITRILGSENQELNFDKNNITKIIFCGLQGSGKTTTVAKLANFISKKSKKKILISSTDIYRPAAQEQLKILCNKINIDFLEANLDLSINELSNKIMTYCKKNMYDVLLVDTAGRQVIDSKMMIELKEIKSIIMPQESILIADSLSGQDAANIAKKFNDEIGITSNILTRIDGDSRGGAALSIKSITGSPIKFIGLGEKIDDFEAFHPERIASRILGMGDIVSLVEKASENINKNEAEKLVNKISKGSFDLEDFSKQLKQMSKIGGVSSMLSLLPGISKIQKQAAENNISDEIVQKQLAIISSMTKKERRDPEIIKASRKIRISNGSGTKVQDVNKLLKQFFTSVKMMKKMKSMGNQGNPKDLMNQLKNLPPNFN
ncbi:MAG: Signal recognition particle protein [Alphaproteobacteria bacterium MarineAlpha5_Bin9]|nr:MAG: Signal recognition particle protein [Alphaproteobacteria bacterium MarineAlpha5_Bin9]|tara:strand:- start:361 stop:1725 length:1365 start_codon:yes stop_codon:yes gene_type:complete